jgi:hypothetical protein
MAMVNPASENGAAAPWARPEVPGRFTVAETATRIGWYTWLEMRLFEVLGTWVAVVPQPELKERLATHCYHHAFHAELWHKRLPEFGEVNPESLVRPPSPGVEAVLDALVGPTPVGAGDDDGDDDRGDRGAAAEPGASIDRLVGFYRVVLPRLIGAYTFHQNGAAHVTDAPTIRILDLCLRDDQEQWRDGELMIQTLLGSEAEVDRAIDRQRLMDKLVVGAGGIVGPGSIG